MLKNQQELYFKEGLDWTKIDFYDNQPICDLIDKVRNIQEFKKNIGWKLVSIKSICNWFLLATTWGLLSNGGSKSS